MLTVGQRTRTIFSSDSPTSLRKRKKEEGRVVRARSTRGIYAIPPEERVLRFSNNKRRVQRLVIGVCVCIVSRTTSPPLLASLSRSFSHDGITTPHIYWLHQRRRGGQKSYFVRRRYRNEKVRSPSKNYTDNLGRTSPVFIIPNNLSMATPVWCGVCIYNDDVALCLPCVPRCVCVCVTLVSSGAHMQHAAVHQPGGTGAHRTRHKSHPPNTGTISAN